MAREVIDRREGRSLFGSDPAAYDAARPGHAERVYEVLVERCRLHPGARVLEIGPGTGQATRRLLELGARPLVAIEPDPALAQYLARSLGTQVDIRVVALEDAVLADGSFDLAAAASSFHWVDEAVGLARVFETLRPGGWAALWWTLFGSEERDAFMRAIDPLFEDLPVSPSHGGKGRSYFGVDSEARMAALEAAGFAEVDHEVFAWTAGWDTNGIRTLYGTFSPIAVLDEARRARILDGIAAIAERDFGGHVERTLRTSFFSARKPT